MPDNYFEESTVVVGIMYTIAVIAIITVVMIWG